MKNKKTRARLFCLFLIVALFFSANFLLRDKIIEAAWAADITGWFWGGGAESDGSSPWDGTNTNVGWISASSSNCDSDGDGFTDTGNYSNCPVGAPVGSYQVSIPEAGCSGAGCNVAGYAWSENLGWINFDPEGPYPPNPDNVDYSARRTADGYLEGWARFVSIADASEVGNSGGWYGWIKLRGGNYGVKISSMDGTGTNPTYAWSDELGWIDFSRIDLGVPKKLVVCPDINNLEIVDDVVDKSSVSLTAYLADEGSDCDSLINETIVTDLSDWSGGEAEKVEVNNTDNKGKVTGLAATRNGDGSFYSVFVQADYSSYSGKAVVCVSDGSCAADICQGSTCTECGYTYNGTKECSGTQWQEVTP